MSSISDIEKLVELFKTASNEEQIDEQEHIENDLQCTSSQHLDQNKSRAVKKTNPYAKIEEPHQREIPDPEDDDVYFDVNDVKAGQSDWKQTPKWDISYKQSVSATDVFLGMGFKTPSTSSCENMIITVNLPGECRQNVDLKIEERKLVLVSPKFFLSLNLPQPVDPKQGNAQFDTELGKLIITLRMNRELDLLNF